MLIKIHWVMSAQLGLDIRLFFRFLYSLPYYLRSLIKFRKNYFGTLKFTPCLHDMAEEGGATKNEYFLQDLFVAQRIFSNNPKRHVDVGSRVDGFVAHVASFRNIEVFDVRPFSTVIPGVIFHQANVMDFDAMKIYYDSESDGYCDSLSCLHAIEHFGLGRYGDPIDPIGYQNGISNLAALLKPGGFMYLSTPIGRERVEFNANWVFNPNTIIDCATKNNLQLIELWIVDLEKSDVQPCLVNIEEISKLSLKYYQLGIFIFSKEIININVEI